MDMHHALLNIGLLVVSAKLAEGLLRHVGLNSIIAYTAAGALLGPITGIVDSTDGIRIFLNIGVFLLFFNIGLHEIDLPGFMATMRGRYFVAATLSVVISVVASMTVTSDLVGGEDPQPDQLLENATVPPSFARHALEGVTVKSVMDWTRTYPGPAVTAMEFVDKWVQNHQLDYLVVDKGAPAGIVSLGRLRRLSKGSWPTTSLADVMQRSCPRAWPDEPIDEETRQAADAPA